MSASVNAPTVGSGGRVSASAMIRLAPSPRDVAAASLSPRSRSTSFRSSSSSLHARSAALSPRSVGPVVAPRGGLSVQSGGPPSPSAPPGPELSPEMSTALPCDGPHSKPGPSPPAGPVRTGARATQLHIASSARSRREPAPPASGDGGPANSVAPSRASKAAARSRGGGDGLPTLALPPAAGRHSGSGSSDPFSAVSSAPPPANPSGDPRSTRGTAPAILPPAVTPVAEAPAAAVGTGDPAPAPAAASAAMTAPGTAAPPAGAVRSKRMLVIDPKSGRKYHLHADDHSLTDKELLIYHKRKSQDDPLTQHPAGRGAGAAEPATPGSSTAAPAPVSASRRPGLAVDTGAGAGASVDTSPRDGDGGHTLTTELRSLGETLETASALTEATFGANRGRGRLGGGALCLAGAALAGFLPYGPAEGARCTGAGARAAAGTGEQRDDAESIEKERYRALLEETGEAGDAAGPSAMSAADSRGKAGPKYTRYDDEGNTFHTSATDPAAGGPAPAAPLLTSLAALGNQLVSPRLAGLARSFFDAGSVPSSAVASPGGGASTAGEARFRRLCLVVFPVEVRQCLGRVPGGAARGRPEGLLGLRFTQDTGDFQAHVASVQRGSRAARMGVRKGDIVSFAVALSNMTEEQNSFLAEKLIKRLESVGMRTSYRELYDIFLSKTTNERPIGIVFRRWMNRVSGGGGSGSTPANNCVAVASPKSPLNVCITDEFDWSTDFLQSLSIKCREYEFEKKVPISGAAHSKDAEGDFGGVPVADDDGGSPPLLRSFLPLPNVDTAPKKTDYLNGMLDHLTGAGSMMRCMEPTLCGLSNNREPPSSSPNMKKEGAAEFLSNRTLCSLVEQSMGLIFMRIATATDTRGSREKKGSPRSCTGTGFVVVRKAEGSWSAPCFLSLVGSKDKFAEDGSVAEESNAHDQSSPSMDAVKMIVIRKKELVNNLIQGNAIKFIVRVDERANVLVRDSAVVIAREGRFQLATDFAMSARVNDVQNQGAYSLSTDHIEASDILVGTISPPEQSIDFYGALQSLELPYSMHSHPVIPDMLQRFSESDWVEFLPDHESAAADGCSSCGMRTKLQMIADGDSAQLEARREIDIFARKFKYYLMDGVPVHRILFPNKKNSNNRGLEEKVLRLTINDPDTLFSSSLELSRKRLPGVSNVGIPSNFSTAFENVTKLSRTPPMAYVAGFDVKERKRFLSIETDLSPGPVMMLAKSKKDATILLCGLKLLLEREKLLSN